MTAIEWTDITWNPVTGCTKVSPGCANCYAEKMATRLRGRFGYPADEPFRVTLHPDRLDEPLRWRKPRRVFVCSMSDLFHEDVPDEFVWDVLDAMYGADRHTYQVLTKRPKRMRELVDEWHGAVRDYDGAAHIWLGVSAEDQQRADERIPILLDTPAAVRFVSAEPLLGPLTLRADWLPPNIVRAMKHEHDTGRSWEDDHATINWLIVGGESGHNARPMHPDWARSIRDQCQAAGVPFFFKQWGEWCSQDGCPHLDDAHYGKPRVVHNHSFVRCGKKAAGRLLDGKEWSEFPEEGRTR